MPKITIPSDIKEIKDLDFSECTHPAGHCFGSDGGTGIPENLKVPIGRGGEIRAWELDSKREAILQDNWYLICQYCLKAVFVETNEERQKKENTEV